MIRIEEEELKRINLYEEKGLKKACKLFESYFLFLLLKEMDKAARIEKKTLSVDTWMSFLYEKLSDHLAERGTGIKEMLEKALKFYREKDDNFQKK